MLQSGATDKLFYSIEIAAIIRRPWCTVRNKNCVGSLLARNCSSLYPWFVQGWKAGWCCPKRYTQTLTTMDFSSAYLFLHTIHPVVCIVHFPFLHSVLIKPFPHAKCPSQSSASNLSEEVFDGEAGVLALLETDVFFCFSVQLLFTLYQNQISKKTVSLRNRFFFHFVMVLGEYSFIPKIDFVLQKH